MLQVTRPSTFVLEGDSGGGIRESNKHEENYYVTQGGWEIKEMIKESGNFRNASQGNTCLVIFRYTYRRM